MATLSGIILCDLDELLEDMENLDNKIMTPNQYQAEANRTNKSRRVILESSHAGILHSAIGVSSEAGELSDAVKKCIFYNQPLDRENIFEEYGDLLWYIAIGLSYMGKTMEECMEANIEKLKIRYPEKFTEELAAKRLDKQDAK